MHPPPQVDLYIKYLKIEYGPSHRELSIYVYNEIHKRSMSNCVKVKSPSSLKMHPGVSFTPAPAVLPAWRGTVVQPLPQVLTVSPVSSVVTHMTLQPTGGQWSVNSRLITAHWPALLRRITPPGGRRGTGEVGPETH